MLAFFPFASLRSSGLCYVSAVTVTAPIPCAIVGTGRVARYHAAGYARHAAEGRCELVACVDPTIDKCREFTAKYAAEHGRPAPAAHDDLAAMLAEHRPRLVSVCTPPGSHADVAVAAMEGGAWAYVEKPVCTSLAELDRIFEAEERTGQRACGVLQWRSAGSARRFVDLARGGRFGRLLACLCSTTWYRDDAYFAVPWRGKWATEAGGTVVSHAVHAIDLMLAAAGDWAEVRALAATVARDVETEDAAAAAVRFADGGVGSVLASALSPRQQTLLRFDFEKATVELDHFTFFTRQHWRVTPAPGHEDVANLLDSGDDDPPQQGTQLRTVLDALASGDRDAPGLVVGGELRRTLEFVTALYKSAHAARPVLAGEVVPGDPFHAHLGGPAALV